MKGLALVFGGPKGGKGGGDKPPGVASPFGKPDDEAAEGEAAGGSMDGARKDAVRAVAKALGSDGADIDSLDSALQAFVEACSGGGYSEKG